MLNISKQIYAGWSTLNTKHDLPEALVIPYGTAINERKKLEKITKDCPILKEFENIPLPGFTLYKTDRKNWGSIDQTWLVIDPRGYLVRITNENLEEILYVTGITEGLIQEKCVWARENSQTKMKLVPVSSPDYIEASKNTELIEGKVNIKDVEIGDMVLLQNKLIGEYMGVVSLYGPIVGGYSEAKPQSFIRRQVVKISIGKYFYQSDVKILKIIEKSSLKTTREKSIELINEEIEKGIAYFSNTEDVNTGSYFSTRGLIKLASIHAIPNPKLSLVEVDIREAEDLFYTASISSDSYILLLKDTAGKFYNIDFPYSFSSQRADINSFSVTTLTSINPKDIKLIEVRESYSVSRTKPRFSLDKFAKFYKIVKHVKDETYI